MVETIKAIAMLCALHSESPAWMTEKYQAACQRKLAICIKDKFNPDLALINCIAKEEK